MTTDAFAQARFARLATLSHEGHDGVTARFTAGGVPLEVTAHADGILRRGR